MAALCDLRVRTRPGCRGRHVLRPGPPDARTCWPPPPRRSTASRPASAPRGQAAWSRPTFRPCPPARASTTMWRPLLEAIRAALETGPGAPTGLLSPSFRPTRRRRWIDESAPEPRPRPLFALVAAACTGSNSDPAPTVAPSGPSFNAEVASADLYVGEPQRFLLGILAGDADGDPLPRLRRHRPPVRLPRRRHLAPVAGSGRDRRVPRRTRERATDGAGPPLRLRPRRRGVYQAGDVTFDQTGTWQVTARAESPTSGPPSLRPRSRWRPSPRFPRPDRSALRTENLT